MNPQQDLILYHAIMRTLSRKTMSVTVTKIMLVDTDKTRPTDIPQILRASGQYTHGLPEEV